MHMQDGFCFHTQPSAEPPPRRRVVLRALGAVLAGWALGCGAVTGAPGPAPAPAREAYELQPLAQATVADDMQRCVGPKASTEQLHGFLARALTETTDGDPLRGAQLALAEGSGVVLAAAGQWACVPLSKEGFPVWPLEAMHGLIVPVGVPAALTRAWRRNLLSQVARDGVGRGLIVYPSGEADQVHVIAEQRQALQVKFTMRMLPAGSYKETQYPAVLRHPGLTRLVTRSNSAGAGTPWRMAIPPHRLLKPVREGFVVVEPTPQTSRFSFEGTQWLVGGDSGAVTLLPDGTVAAAAGETRTSSQGAKLLGRWRVADGVLQLALADGTRYALTLRDNPQLLTGVGRRDNEEAPEDEGGEAQWPAQIHRHSPGGTTGKPMQQARAQRAAPPPVAARA